jgi:glycosyl transferase family 87
MEGKSRLHRFLSESRLGGPLLLIAAGAAVAAFGVLGVGRYGGEINGDMRYLYAAGHAWLAGKNPYVMRDMLAVTPDELGLDYRAMGFTFGYPPQSSLLCMALAALTFRTASALMVVLNVASAFALAFGCIRLAAREDDRTTYAVARTGTTGIFLVADASRILRWFVPILVLGSPFTQHVIFMGQTSLLAGALCVWGWCLAEDAERNRRSLWWAGLLLGAATVKPQISLLPIVMLALEGRILVVGVASLASLLWAAPALIINGPSVCVRSWLAAVNLYRQSDMQLASFRHVFGIESLFVSGGVNMPSLYVVAFAALLAIRWQAHRLSSLERFGLTLATSCLFVFSHDYDLVILAPLFAALWMRTRDSNTQAFALLVAILGIFIPQRLVATFFTGPALHWRECLVLGVYIWAGSPFGQPHAPVVEPRLVLGTMLPAASPPAVGEPMTGWSSQSMSRVAVNADDEQRS